MYDDKDMFVAALHARGNRYRELTDEPTPTERTIIDQRRIAEIAVREDSHLVYDNQTVEPKIIEVVRMIGNNVSTHQAIAALLNMSWVVYKAKK